MFTDLVLFHRIVYGSVCIKLPYYVVKWEPKDVVKCTRNSKCIFDGSDKLKFRCTVTPKVKAFEAVADVSHYAGAGVVGSMFGASGDGFHGVDEYVDIQSMIDTTKVIAGTVIDICGIKE